MRRSTCFALLGLVMTGVPVLAQETAPAPAEPAAPAEAAPAPAPGGAVDPAATAFALPANPNDLLTGLYATRAMAELCSITIDPATLEAMAADEAAFIEQLQITQETADSALAEIRTAIEGQAPDCTPGSTDVAGVEEVLAVYASGPESAAAAPAAGTTTPAATTPAAPTEATPEEAPAQ